MTTTLSRLKERWQFLDTRIFHWISWIASILGPLPLSFQLYKALTAANVEGIAIEAYLLLCLMHLIMICRGIKKVDPQIATTFAITSIIAGSIVITVIIRGGTFIFW